ncbi:hypothetical protein JD844_032501 [Phrynosoma platyrhinos]|uniref:Organic solute transporter subunit alpha n=1 Tax=Phrynosoma platyrhinos TaxID=52577 RepID=A0ABQ7T502_PHRPL|nr:hypothetical protein JD844_032501 [Phrynosoma platyrhinos]
MGFFAIVIHKFLLMMIKECGGQKLFLRRFENDHFKISTGPCCCCCLCLPYIRITSNLCLKADGNMAWTIIYILGHFDFQLSLSGAAIWINCFIGVLTIIALWPIGIMFQQVRVILNCKKIIPKFALYQFVLILSQLQVTIINILAMEEVIACVPPLSSSARGAYINQQLLIVEMFLITLISRVVYRKRYDDLALPPGPEQETSEKQKSKIDVGGNIFENDVSDI